MTLVEKFLDAVKNNKIAAIVIIVGIGVIGLAQFVDSFQTLTAWWSSGTALDEPIVLGDAEITFHAPARLANIEGTRPRWANTSDAFVFTAPTPLGEGTDVLVSRDRGRSAETVHRSERLLTHASFSPDDRYIAFVERIARPATRRAEGTLGVLHRLHLETGEIRTFAESPVLYGPHAAIPYDWSQRMPFPAWMSETGTTLIDATPDAGLFQAQGSSSIARTSPDGERLAVATGGGGEFNVYIFERGGIAETPVPGATFFGNFDWLDDDTLVGDTGGAGQYCIATFDVATGQSTYLTKFAYFLDPEVRAGRVAYKALSETSGRTSILVMDAADKQPETLLEFDAPDRNTDVSYALRPDGRELLVEVDGEIFLVEVDL